MQERTSHEVGPESTWKESQSSNIFDKSKLQDLFLFFLENVEIRRSRFTNCPKKRS